MAGARATGKSFYIAVAVRQLELLLLKLRQSMDFANESTRRNYTDNYEKPLLVERGIIPATPSAITEGAYQRDPLIISIGGTAGQRRYLVLRDVAGEDLETESSDIRHLQFFRHADTVVFMFDPKRVNQVQELLRGIEPEEDRTGGDPRTVLSNVLRTIGDGDPHIAVVLAKFDTMHKLRKVHNSEWSRVMSNAGAAALRDPGLSSSYYDDADGGLLDAEVRSMLQRLDAESFMVALEHPPRGKPFVHRFFAVSVLGESISGGRVHSRGIAPFRCLDPLRWALAYDNAAV